MADSKEPAGDLPAPADREDLEARLRDRELRLSELTQQSLHLLDELTKAREEVRDHARLRRSIARLEELLADTRRRVRAAGSAIVHAGAQAGASCEIVLWGASGPLELAPWLARRGETPLTVICRKGVTASEVWDGPPDGLRLIESDCRTPVQFWNLAVASTDASAVLCIPAGAAPKTELALPELDEEAVALVALTIVDDGGSRALGLVETEGLRLETVPLKDDGEDSVALDFAAPEAFAVIRGALHGIGPFDEDLHGELALADFALRARAKGYRIVGLPAIEVAVPDGAVAGDAGEQSDAGRDRDRLIALARHRPGQVGEALMSTGSFRAMNRSERGELLRAIWQRLPGVGQWREGVEVLVQEAMAVARHSVPASLVREHLAQVADILGEDGDVDVERYPERLAEICGQLRDLQAKVEAAHHEKEHLGEILRAREQTVLEQGKALDELRTELAAHVQALQGHKDELVRQAEAVTGLSAYRDEVAAQRGELAAQRETLAAELAVERGRLEELLECVAATAAALGLQDETQPEALVRRAAELKSSLADREQWIRALLGEVSGRRLKLFPRKLQDHEREFLDGGRDSGR